MLWPSSRSRAWAWGWGDFGDLRIATHLAYFAGAKIKMAEVGMNPLPSGYEYEFISTVLDDHHCLICHLPLREPVQTRCGHRFCKKCLDEAIRRYENRLWLLITAEYRANFLGIFVGAARWLGSPD